MIFKNKFNKLVKGVIKIIDVLLFLLGTILLDLTIYLNCGLLMGGIVTSITLVIWGVLTEFIFNPDGKGGDR